MEQMTKDQKRVIELLESATKKEKLNAWVRGYIPDHYKRISISRDEQLRLAEIGALAAITYFEVGLYFTQSIILGIILDPEKRYDKADIITNSQYGKSFVLGMGALLLGNRGEKVNVCGATDDTTDIIMEKIIDHIQYADKEIQNKIIDTGNKLERLQQSASKNKIAFIGGGMIKKKSLGESFSGQKGNKMIGQAEHVFIDEASQISPERDAETGRAEFSAENGERFLNLRISNPHNPGMFMDSMYGEVEDGEVIIWMDVRTAYEEGRVKSIDQVRRSKFFKNKSTCRRYLLCELEDYTEEQMFGEPLVDDSDIDMDADFFLGVDSAYKGKDDVYFSLSAKNKDGIPRLLNIVKLQTSNWVDGVTGKKIIESICRIIVKYKVKRVCIDAGYGVYIIEGVAAFVLQSGIDCVVDGIHFSQSPDPARKKAGHYSAVWAENKRAEMHMDFQELIDMQKLYMTTEVKEQLQEQMSLIKAIRKKNGKTAIIPKEQIKTFLGRSPDQLDSALLSIHAMILYTIYEPVYIYSQ